MVYLSKKMYQHLIFEIITKGAHKNFAIGGILHRYPT